MASKFRAGESGTSGQNREFRNVNRIVKEGVIWVPPFLSQPKEGDDDPITEIRLFPPVEDNELQLVLNPATTDDTPMRSRLADTFLDIEYVSRAGGLGGKGIETEMITSVKFTDAGEEAPHAFYTPYREFVFRLRSKIEEQFVKSKEGLPVDIPRDWFNYRDKGGFKEGVKYGRMPYPTGRGNVDRDTGKKRPDLYMVQCMALYINGACRRDPKTGKERWQAPCVFTIPSSAAANFFDALTTRADDEQPLSATNNQLGDCFSLKEGKTLRLKKLEDGKYVLRLARTAPLTEEYVLKVYHPWSELIVVPTVEQSIKWICEAFDDPRMIDFAFRPVEGNSKSGNWYQFVPEEWRGLASDIAEPLSKDALKEFIAVHKKSRPAGTAPQTSTAPRPPAFTNKDDDQLDGLPIDDGSYVEPDVVDADAPPDLDPEDGPVPSGIDPKRYAKSLANIQQVLDVQNQADNNNPNVD